MAQYSYTSLNNMASGGRGRRLLFLVAVPLFILVMYYTYHRNMYSKPAVSSPLTFHNNNVNISTDDTMRTVIKALYEPILHPVAAHNFTDEDGDVYQLSKTPRFREKLGKKVLVLDIDSRPMDGPGQLMNEQLEWKGMRPLAAGMLSHYTYAMIHGYDYKLIRAPDYESRWGTWVKVPLMKEALKTHDYIVFMDSDVVVHYPHLPLEWLMNYWNMTEETLVMMAIDPDEPQNYDSRGNRYLNTGFIIAQSSKRTQKMYRDWANCPSNTRYKDCSRWKYEMFHEQSAFGNYIRYDYNRPDDIRVLPCAEANGCPEAINRGGCKGTFIRHYWIDKGQVSKALGDQVMQYFLPRLHQMYHDPASETIVDAKGFRLDGSELIELTPEEKEAHKDEHGKNQKDEGW